MENSEDLLQQLVQRVNTQLDLCESSETPIICAMLENDASRQKLVELVVKKVVDQQMDVSAAIVAINDEFDPNVTD